MVLPQTLSLLETRSVPLGIELVVGDHQGFDFGDDFYGALLQYPGKHGQVFDYAHFVAKAKAKDIKVAVAADILSLVLLTPPGEFGVDVVVGTTQRFGIPMGYGGPHAAFFATKEEYKRNIPGRIIGVTKDTDGKTALRMALQTREQHIKRDKATSNICTAQVLLAVMAGMYAVYHGPNGLKYIAKGVHAAAKTLGETLGQLGVAQQNTSFFDTLKLKAETKKVRPIAERSGVNFLYIDQETIAIAVNEATSLERLATNREYFCGSPRKKPRASRRIVFRFCHRCRGASQGAIFGEQGFQFLSFRNRTDALYQKIGAERFGPQPFHDRFGKLHHEVECRHRNAALELGAMGQHPSVCPH